MTLTDSISQGGERSSPASSSVTVDVTTFLDLNGVDYDLDWWDSNGKSGGRKDPIEFQPESGSHVITFHLKKDNTGLKLRFPENPADAMYVAVGTKPTGPGNGGQITFISVDQSRKQLTVSDDNRGPACDLHYELNFVAEDGTSYPVDPIIRNGGGGGGIF